MKDSFENQLEVIRNQIIDFVLSDIYHYEPDSRWWFTIDLCYGKYIQLCCVYSVSLYRGLELISNHCIDREFLTIKHEHNNFKEGGHQLFTYMYAAYKPNE